VPHKATQEQNPRGHATQQQVAQEQAAQAHAAQTDAAQEHANTRQARTHDPADHPPSGPAAPRPSAPGQAPPAQVQPAQDTIDRLRLARAEGVGPVTYRRLLARFGTAAAALKALPGLAKAGGRSSPPTVPTEADAILELQRTAKLGARLLLLGDAGYPPLLARLDDAPPVIAVQGDPALLAARAVALVGGRNASVNGCRIAEDLAADLARAGLVIVSGMARGIDAAAHAGALSIGHPPGGHPPGGQPHPGGQQQDGHLLGRTIAVVAGGLDVPYPPEHADLQRRIAAAGAVVTEAPPGTVPQSSHFPRRNRIIAGLALGVVVVEAAPRSGSLITARLATEAGREVFAVPGSPLDPRSRGGNDLIRQGAVLVETAADVLANLPDDLAATAALLFAEQTAPDAAPGFAEPPLPDPDFGDSASDRAAVYAQVLDLLGPSPTPVDAVLRRCQFSAPAVMAALLELELAGRVETLPGGRVAALSERFA
jgi:DNA processing protein